MSRPGSIALALFALLSLASSARAQEDDPSAPVRITAEPLFGEGTLLAEGWAPVFVTVQNRTAGEMRAEVHLEVNDYQGPMMRRVAPVDLPPAATRTLVMPVFSQTSGGYLEASVHVGDRRLARYQATIDYAPGGHSLVVFGDPPRLRGGLLDLDVYDPYASGGRQVRVPVGTVRFDAATSDPILPQAAIGWATVKLLVAHAPALRRVGAVERRAIEGWLRAGGRLLVFPRSASELDDPWLSSLMGPVAPIAEEGDGSLVHPSGYGLACTEGQTAEAFGCSRAVGLGRVYLASYDGTTPAAIESGAPRELVRSIYGSWPELEPGLAFGRGVDNLSRQDMYSGNGAIGRLRALLDPNEGFRPALGLVAVVLFLYVLVVGPLNFRWVQKRGKPTLALLTTPLAAAGCVALLLLVGFVGKGVKMRYRQVSLTMAHEGDAGAYERRYTGYFATRPGTFDLPGAGPDGLALRLGAGASRGPIYRREGDGVALRSFRAGLWETTFLREDRSVELDGAITFERDGTRLASVTNHGARALRGTVVMDPTGAVYAVGDVAPGATAPIPISSALSVSPRLLTGAPLADAMHLGEDGAPLAEAMAGLLGDRLIPQSAPVLYAWLDVAPGPVGGFEPETVSAWIRVTPRVDGHPVPPALPPDDDPYAAAEATWEPDPPAAAEGVREPDPGPVDAGALADDELELPDAGGAP